MKKMGLLLRKRWPWLLALLLIVLSPAASGAQTGPNSMNFQGRLLDDAGQPRSGETHCMRFRICTDEDCLSQVWPESGYESHAVTTEGGPYTAGLFTVDLGTNQPLPPTLMFDYDALYLEIGVADESSCPGATWSTLIPRSPLRANAFAQRSRRVRTTESDDEYLIAVVNTGVGGGIYAETDSAADGTAAGYFRADAENGQTYGVYAWNDSTSDYAAAGAFEAYGSSGQTYGVQGTIYSTAHYAAAVHGWAIAGSGENYGVYGHNNSSSSGAAGVYGQAGQNDGVVYGVYGYNDSNNVASAAVYGHHARGGYGVLGYADVGGYGVYASGSLGDLMLGGSGKIRAYDNVEIHLDADADDNAAFCVRDDADNVVFAVAEDGNIFGLPNQAPVAILQADPALLMPGQTTTTLSLALSYDPEGSALSFAFDHTGRTPGVPGAFSGSATAVGTYTEPGDYLAAGWVQDSSGSLNRAQALVTLAHFQRTNVRQEAIDGPSMVVVNGHPAIAYATNIGKDLCYTRSGDASGSVWDHHAVSIDMSGDVGHRTFMAIVQGNPAVAYSTLSGNLQYARSNGVDGAIWSAPVVVDGPSILNPSASFALVVVNGRPAIAYQDDANQDLLYVRADDATGTTWSTAPVVVDNSGNLGMHVSMVVVEGQPAIAYSDSNGDLFYVRAQNADGTSWNTPVTVDTAIDSGLFHSLAIVDGRPAIAYFDGANLQLKYVRANDTTGLSWGTPIIVDDDFMSYAYYASLAVVNGRPAIAYYDDGRRDLRYVWADNAQGSSWGAPIVVDGTGIAAGYCAVLAVVYGRPAIAHYDATNEYLVFAYPRTD